MKSDHPGSPQRTLSGLLNDLFEVAVEAAVQSFLVILFGNIAMDILGGVVRGMVPSAPPGFAPGWAAPSTWMGGWAFLKAMQFQLIFSIAFVIGMWARYGRSVAGGQTPARARRWRRVSQRFAQNWFGSLVGNAFIASALAGVVLTIPKLSFWHWGWNWLSSAIPAEKILGETWLSELRVWIGWYDSNQLRFTFWVIYLGAICDDLGLPNYKSLARWLWRKQRNPRRRSVDAPAPDDFSASPPAITQTDPESPPRLTAP